MSGQHPSPTLELEIAVARGREYLVRVLFRPPSVVSVGTNPRASITLPDASLPDFHELLHLGPTSWLAFDTGMDLEMQVAGAIMDTGQLIDRGLALEAREGWRLPLHTESKGLIRFGELRVLLKARSARDATIWSVSPEGGACCGGCGSVLRWTLQALAALSPCPKCGDLNRVEGSIADLELGRTSMVRALGGRKPTGAEPPSAPFVIDEDDTVSDADVPVVIDDMPPPGQRPRGADLPTYDGIAGMKAGDLPTFDAIQARQAAELPPTSDALRSPRLMAEEAARKQPKAAGLGPRQRMPDVGPSKGADLPTFDAIQAFKVDADLSTRAAISVMKEGEPSPPAGLDADTEPPVPAQPLQIGPKAAPAPEPPPPAPEVDPALQVTIKRAPPLGPLPDPPPPPAKEPPPPEPEPHTSEPEPPSPEPATTTSEPEPPPPLRPPAPRAPAMAPPEPAEVDETADDDDDDETRPTPPQVPPMDLVGPTRPVPVMPREPAFASADAVGPEPDRVGDPDSGDDFLMGRSDGGIRVRQNLLGWVLVGMGLLAGAIGCLLILVAVLFWQGII